MGSGQGWLKVGRTVATEGTIRKVDSKQGCDRDSDEETRTGK